MREGDKMTCPTSPTLAHHWLLDSLNYGVCLYCDSEKDFGGKTEIAWREQIKQEAEAKKIKICSKCGAEVTELARISARQIAKWCKACDAERRRLSYANRNRRADPERMAEAVAIARSLR